MSEEKVVTTKAEMAEALKAIGPNENGAYEFGSRTPPAGYTTLREVWKHADIHPSWLRTLISRGAFEQYDEEGVPAVIKNTRGVWAVSIAACVAYESGKRVRTPAGEGTGAKYTYVPHVLRNVRRTLSEFRARNAPEEVISYTEALEAQLTQEWKDGKLGKEADNGDDDEAETESQDAGASEELDAEDLDFEFDFEDEDED